MSVDAKTIENMASLCRLEIGCGLPQEEKDKAQAVFCKQLSKLIDYTARISEADTESVEPLFSLNSTSSPRADVPMEESISEALLEQAPGRTANFFAVPKVI